MRKRNVPLLQPPNLQGLSENPRLQAVFQQAPIVQRNAWSGWI